LINAEDLKHMLFGCSRAQEIWRGLGLVDCVIVALAMDQSGSMVLKELLCSNKPGGIGTNVENKTMIIMIACWYIWWSRRHIKHKEEVPTIDRTMIDIKGMVANCAN
jgi:hypothetical protein